MKLVKKCKYIKVGGFKMSKISTYSIIPSYIMYDRGVSPLAKLLYGSITSLSNAKGYCYATNGYLAELYGVTIRTVQRKLEELQERGYIESNVIRKDNQQVEERRIWITEIKRSLDAFVSNPNNPGHQISIDDEPYISWMKD